MNMIVTPYPFERDIFPHDQEIFKNEKHFIKKTRDIEEKHDLKKPVASVQDAVAVYNKVYGCAHCVITKHDY